MLELIQQIFYDMRAHKLRSFLALFGVVWGTVAVVVLLALGQGFYVMGKESMAKLSSGVIFAVPRSTTFAYAGLPQGQALHVKARDIVELGEALDIEKLSPKLRATAPLVYQAQSQSAQVSGVAAQFAEINTLSTEQSGGRFLSEKDELLARRVVVLGSDLAENLFKQKDPLNQTLSIKGLPFLVVGVLDKNNSGFNFGDGHNPGSAFIPYTTFNVMWGDVDISYFTIVPDHVDESTTLKKSITRYFAVKFHFDPNDDDAIYMPNVAQFAEFFSAFFKGVQLFLGFCGAMTLGVGGVGVANIMFLIVSERTREIGLRMALGAKSFHILSQILLEAFVIVMLGATVGFGLSWFIVKALSLLTLPDWLGVPVISMTVVYMTILVLSMVALLSGFFPAKRASKLDPVVALAS